MPFDKEFYMLKILKEIQDLTAPNLQKRVYVAFSYPVVPAEQIVPHMPKHLRYMAQAEDQVFLSGPFIKDGQIVGEGMTVLHTDSDVKAAAFMRNEPLIRRGLRRFDLELWELREGTFSVATRLSDSSFALE
jgi:uncharacterized protein YciI